jgi:hypothetical protein
MPIGFFTSRQEKTMTSQESGSHALSQKDFEEALFEAFMKTVFEAISPKARRRIAEMIFTHFLKTTCGLDGV